MNKNKPIDKFIVIRIIYDTSFPGGIHYYTDTANILSGCILTSSVDEHKNIDIKLIDIKTNIEIKKWHIIADSILTRTNSSFLNEKNLRATHPFLLKDSSIIFNTTYSLVKVDKNSKIIWCRGSTMFHHSIEYVNDSCIWTCSVFVDKKPLYIIKEDSLLNDAIALINTSTGKTIFQKSIYDILNDNGYDYLLAIGKFTSDAIHLNEVYPAKTNSKYWQIGDLLVSMRNRSTIFLYRPSTNKILWLKTGPWNNQHSCKFIDDKNIVIFGNDVISTPYNFEDYLFNQRNHIYIYSFETNTVDTPYYKVLNKINPKTLTEGRCSILPNGDIFMEETMNGRIYIFNKDTLKLTYSKRVDDKHIQIQNWSRFIPSNR